MFREELRTVNIDLSKFGENFSASIVSCSGMYNEQIKLFEEVDLCDRRTKKIFPLEKWVANLETVSKRGARTGGGGRERDWTERQRQRQRQDQGHTCTR